MAVMEMEILRTSVAAMVQKKAGAATKTMVGVLRVVVVEMKAAVASDGFVAVARFAKGTGRRGARAASSQVARRVMVCGDVGGRAVE